MIDQLKKIIEENIGDNIIITDHEMKEAAEETAKDLVYNYLIFEKDVSFEIFIRNLTIYLNLVKKLDDIFE